MKPLALNAILLDHNARAPDDLTGIAFPVDLAKPCPGSEVLGVSNLD
jgi:hypothetical protein